MVGDLRAIVPQLVDALKDSPRQATPELAGWITDDATRITELAESAPGGTPLHTARFVVEATKAFPEDGIMVRDGGATVIFQWTYSQAKPHDVVWNQNFGHIGTGLPYAVGASVADGRKKPVMLLTSDSSFMFAICRAGNRCAAATFRWSASSVSTTSGASRSACTSAPSARARWRPACTGARTCGSTRSPRASVAAASTSTSPRISGPRSNVAYASGKVTVIHVPIDPKVNSEEMPSYDEFRTWYAEGTQ